MGDFDGDGSLDLAAADPYGSAGGEANIIYGPFTSGSTSLGSADAVFTGKSGDALWRTLFIEDQNSDGAQEILLGSGHNSDVTTENGVVYVFLGGTSSTSVTSAFASIYGGSVNGHFSTAMATLDEGGTELIAITSPRANSARGQVYLFPFSSISAGGSFYSWSLSGVSTYYGESTGHAAGQDVVGLDHDGDGYDSLVTSDYNHSWPYTNTGSTQYTGGRVYSAGDVDEDGYEDLMVSSDGKTFIFLSPWSTTTTTITDTASADIALTSGSPMDAFDFDGDGAVDLLTQDMDNSTDANEGGAVYLLLGTVASGTYGVTDMDAEFYGQRTDGWFGGSGTHGDLDDDGYEDLVVVDSGDSSNSYEGAFYVFFGQGL